MEDFEKFVQGLIILKFNLECIQIDGNVLSRTEGITCDDIEQICIARHAYGYYGYKRHDRKNIKLQDCEYGFYNPTSYYRQESIDDHPLPEIRYESWYVLLDCRLIHNARMWYKRHKTKGVVPSDTSKRVVSLGDTADTFNTVVIMADKDTYASKAWSVRKNNEGEEVAVDTYEGHRQKGYGKAVVTRWALNVIQNNKIPFYAHRWGNRASRALAKSLSAYRFADVMSIM